MKFLIVGDIVGYSGIHKLEKEFSEIVKEEKIDFTIVNGENSAHGKGLRKKEYDILNNLGVNVITMGNHIYYRKEMAVEYKNYPNLLIPANVTNLSSHPYVIIQCKGKKIAVFNLIGKVNMGELFEKNTISPFKMVKEVIARIKTEKVDCIFLDFHAETTAEKLAMSHYVKEDITCLFGTHTHVQTSDECILDGKMAYITDVGMTGPKDSVLGLKKEVAIQRFVTEEYSKYECSENDGFLNAIIVEIDDITNLPISIKRCNR